MLSEGLQRETVIKEVNVELTRVRLSWQLPGGGRRGRGGGGPGLTFLYFSSKYFYTFLPINSVFFLQIFPNITQHFSTRRRSVGSTDPNQRCPPINYNYLTNISILVLQIFLYFSSEYFYTFLQNISLLF